MSNVETDAAYLRRAIRLAMNGRGRVEPNPMVGCVIVKNGKVIGEGYHQQFGGPHAEPNALASCVESPTGATAYVTLEPCCHTNKKTPPCTPTLIEAKIARVVIGCLDPNPDVNGKGARQLREAGIQVDGPVLEMEAKQLIAPFLARVNHKRPYVTLKWAESANGKVAGRIGGPPVRISNAASDRVVHELRARCDAVAVGTNTVLNDDPLLTVRDVPKHRPLLRVVLSNTLKISRQSRLVKTALEHPLLVFSTTTALSHQRPKVEELERTGVQIIGLQDAGEGHFSLTDMLSELHARSVTHLLVEPGPTLARAMIRRDQWDRIWIFRSPRPIEAFDGSAAARVEYPETGELELADDRLAEYLNAASDVFFAPVSSADFVLTKEATLTRASS